MESDAAVGSVVAQHGAQVGRVVSRHPRKRR